LPSITAIYYSKYKKKEFQYYLKNIRAL